MDSKTEEREHNKIIFEYLRHFTTLSSGSILLLATFLEKLSANPNAPSLVFISIISFLISIIGSMTAYTIALYQSAKDHDGLDIIGGYGLIATWLGFLTGIISIGTFALANFM